MVLRAHVQIFPPRIASGGNTLRIAHISCSTIFSCHLLKFPVSLEGIGCNFLRRCDKMMLASEWTT
jgi:hypothetical protein